MNEQEKIWIKAPEAARLLSICERKLWELTNRRQIPHYRVPPKPLIFYCPNELRAWAAESEYKTPVIAG